MTLFVCEAAKLMGPFLDSAPKRNLGDKEAFIESVIQIIENQTKEMAPKEKSSRHDGLDWHESSRS